MNKKGSLTVKHAITLIMLAIVLFFMVSILYEDVKPLLGVAKDNIECNSQQRQCACKLTGTDTCPVETGTTFQRADSCPENCYGNKDTKADAENKGGLCCSAPLTNEWELDE